LGIGESITFHGETVAELHADLTAAIEHYLADCEKTGRAAQKSASGRLMLRLPPEVHAAALRAASGSGKSLNQWAAEVLSRASEGTLVL
jgi:predicted HicB family RNase H-like nuclease